MPQFFNTPLKADAGTPTVRNYLEIRSSCRLTFTLSGFLWRCLRYFRVSIMPSVTFIKDGTANALNTSGFQSCLHSPLSKMAQPMVSTTRGFSMTTKRNPKIPQFPFKCRCYTIHIIFAFKDLVNILYSGVMFECASVPPLGPATSRFLLRRKHFLSFWEGV